MTLAQALDFASVFIFAVTGALAANRAQLDFVGFLFVGGVAAVGGGTARDVILDRVPVFWVDDPTYVAVACLAAASVFLGAHRLETRARTILWLDALALAVAVSAGVAAARGIGASWPVELIMGIATGCFGGVMRDVVCNEVPLALRHGELYVTAAFAGGLVSVLTLVLLNAPVTAIMACGVTTFGLRAGSLAFGWRLPLYNRRPPRT